MTNYEHYKEDIEKITRLGLTFRIDKDERTITHCIHIPCEGCMFYEYGFIDKCAVKKRMWADEEYIEPEVDWSKVPVDTPILVRDNEKCAWHKKHFAKYEDNKVYTWDNGSTSFTADNDYSYTSHWKYAKLAEAEK